MSTKRIMVTGVYGLIGSVVYDHLTASPQQYDVYGLARRRQPSERVPEGHTVKIPDEKFVLSDLSNLDQLTQAMAGMDVVVHMAADPGGQRGWHSLLTNNITGAYHLFEACRQSGVKRVIYASSKQVINGYRGQEPYSSIAEARWEGSGAPPMVTHHSPVRPVSIYACTKVWGEALAQHYADPYGLSCLCLRIG